MNPVDFIVIAVIAAIIALAGWYLYKAKKSGKKCIGCPNSGNCAANAAGPNGCCSGQCAGCTKACGKK